MKKLLGLVMFLLCFCLPGRADKDTVSVDTKELEQEIRNVVRDLQVQLPELLKSIRINVQIPEIKLDIPEIHIPEIHVQVPFDVEIHKIEVPEIHIPEINIEIPRIDIQIPKTSE